MSPAYSIHVVPDETTERESCYRAYHPELQGCMSHGSTIHEAIDGLHAARELYLATLQKLGQPIPPPSEGETVVIWQNFTDAPAAHSFAPSCATLLSTELTAHC